MRNDHLMLGMLGTIYQKREGVYIDTGRNVASMPTDRRVAFLNHIRTMELIGYAEHAQIVLDAVDHELSKRRPQNES